MEGAEADSSIVRGNIHVRKRIVQTHRLPLKGALLIIFLLQEFSKKIQCE